MRKWGCGVNLGEAINQFVLTQQNQEMRKMRPLHEWPSDLLVWLFWSDQLEDFDPSFRIAEMIHHELNARGEGGKVAV